MLTRLLTASVLGFFAMIDTIHAQQSTPAPNALGDAPGSATTYPTRRPYGPIAGPATRHRTEAPFASYALVFDHPEGPAAQRRPIGSLLAEIENWLVLHLDLGGMSDLPHVHFTSTAKIAALRYRDLIADPEVSRSSVSIAEPIPTALAMFYDDTVKTIYLSELWTGGTPAELSMLVRGMVLHYQKFAGLTYPCSQTREQIALSAQDEWLKRFGHNLREDFGMDEAAFLLSTECIP